MRNLKLVQNPCHDKIHHIRHGLRVGIKPRRGRQNHHAQLSQRQHVFQVDSRQRRFTRDDNQLALLLQHHIGGTLNQVVAGTVSNGGQRAHRARANHHRVGGVRARGRRGKPRFPPKHRKPVAASKLIAPTGLEVGGTGRQLKLHFLLGDDLRRLRIEQPHPTLCRQQTFQQTQAIRQTRRAGKGEGDGFV